MNTYWFVRKRYGWGWTPATWQGWAVMAIYALLMIINAVRLHSSPVWFAGESVAMSGILILICFLTGESPKWQWGKK